MSNYNGRRAPNVSQYLANLNTVPSAQDIAPQPDFNLDIEGLDSLTNTEFFDFDNFNDTGDLADAPPSAGGNGSANGAQYQFGEFQTYPSVNNSPNTLPPSPPNGLQGTYPPQPHLGFPPHIQAHAGDKRKASATGIPTQADLEEASRLAAEEDKRRRNTAASARFRVKKKQREQALEKQTKEMTDKLQLLEGKVQQLETENKWLRGLLTEKSDGKAPEALSDATTEKESDERSTQKKTDGVGTEDFKDEA